MTNPRLVGAPTEAAGNTALRIAWDPRVDAAKDLPAKYFDEPTLEVDTIVVATALTAEREMTVTIKGAPSSHAGETETFTLYFRDRRHFVACVHAGMDDLYSVAVEVTFSGDAASATAKFAQHVDRGEL